MLTNKTYKVTGQTLDILHQNVKVCFIRLTPPHLWLKTHLNLQKSDSALWHKTLPERH